MRNKFHLKFGFLYKGTDCGYPSVLLMRDLYMTLSIFIQGSGERLYIWKMLVSLLCMTYDCISINTPPVHRNKSVIV